MFAILCAKEVVTGETWNKWAVIWLNGTEIEKSARIAATKAAAALAQKTITFN